MAPVPLTFGCASIYTGGRFDTPSALNELFTILRDAGITRLDSATLYSDCEALLGQANVAAQPLAIDSKSPGGWIPGSLEPTQLRADLHRTLAQLGVRELDTYYVHGPDPAVPLVPWLEVLDEMHRAGRFARLGLSNFGIDEVVAVYEICVERDLVVPSVYQGNYSAFARRQEREIIPTLRELGMSFSAYSPLAGGFLARRSAEELEAPESGGRFVVDPDDPEGKKGGLGLYRELYGSRPKLVDALARWARIAEDAGCSCPAEMAYRWIAWNSILDGSLGDRITIGASHGDQVRKTADWVAKGGLDAETCRKIDALWIEIKDESPLDNLHK